MSDNRVIGAIDENFEFSNNPTPSTNTGTATGSVNGSANVSTGNNPNVQYADQVPQTYDAYNTNTAVETTGISNPLLSPSVDTLGGLTLMDIVQMFVVYAFIGAAALSAIFIFIGGISFILSGGNDEKIKQAINTIRYSIIGLIVTILSFTFVAIVGRMFGLNFMDFLSYEKIKQDINKIVQPFSAQNENSFEVRN